MGGVPRAGATHTRINIGKLVIAAAVADSGGTSSLSPARRAADRRVCSTPAVVAAAVPPVW
jgi:hypothetical protein